MYYLISIDSIPYIYIYVDQHTIVVGYVSDQRSVGRFRTLLEVDIGRHTGTVFAKRLPDYLLSTGISKPEVTFTATILRCRVPST